MAIQKILFSPDACGTTSRKNLTTSTIYFTMTEIQFDPRFIHPFCMTISGPSQSGKTQFVQELLINKDQSIYPTVSKILYCYTSWQDKFEILKQHIKSIQFYEGLPQLTDLENSHDMIIILDDLMSECTDSQRMQYLFTVGSHHNKISVIFLSQNIFCKGKYSRSISLNSNYMILFKNPRDPSQISCLARQIFPNETKYFMGAYNDAIKNQNYGFLLIDLKQDTPDQARLRTIDRQNGNVYVYIKR